MVKSYLPGGSNVSSHEGILAPPGEYVWTCHLCILWPIESTTQTANRSVRPFLHSSRQKVPILYNRLPIHQNCPFPWGNLGQLGNTIEPSVNGGDAPYVKLLVIVGHAITCYNSFW